VIRIDKVIRRSNKESKAIILDALFYKMLNGINQTKLYTKYSINRKNLAISELLKDDLIEVRMNKRDKRYFITGKGIEKLMTGEI
jgi:predicted transcriptional regulator